MEELIKSSFSQDISILDSSINLIVALLLSLLLKFHFGKFSMTLSGKKELARTIPFLTLIVCFIINIVKSSLALSLGLVGALSIVRFRTPIKEPEELVYLFMSIAIGLGCGANQTSLTVISTLTILAVMSLLRIKSRSNTSKDSYLSMDWKNIDNVDIKDVNHVIHKYVSSSDLKRLDTGMESTNVCYTVTLRDADSLVKLPKELQNNFPCLHVTFIDQSRIPGI